MKTESKHYYYWRKDTLFLEVYVQPNASRNAIVGRHGERLKISVTAPPTESQANQELINFMAKYLGVPKSQVNVSKGTQSRNKLMAINSPRKNLDALLAF